MSKHTLGPWVLETVESDCGRIKHLCPVDADGLSLLTVVEHQGVKFAAIYTEDDARLIAAAPELLAHLQFAVKLFEGIPALNATAQVDAMRTAIAKAEGNAI